ncbi:MAG: 30S ribosomal protein S12 methylthiotransferase RimO [Planctomycetota bacterium]
MKDKNRQPVTVGFVALGCPKNMVDGEKMLAEIAQAGYLITCDAENADVVIINTCGFIAPAAAEAFEEIERAVDVKRRGSVKKVIVTGCLPQRLGQELFLQADGIDAIVGLGNRQAIARIIGETLASHQPMAYTGHRSDKTDHNMTKVEKQPLDPLDDRARLRITPAHWAYLRISEGCDHRCSFCTIPGIRGRFRSKPRDLILAEAGELVSAGAVELNLIGQDTTYYGRDLRDDNGLASLLEEFEDIADLAWIRLMYSYPAGINDRLIETIAAGKKVVHYIDMPIQHINNQVLKAMRRPDTREGICALIEKLRIAIGDIVLRTTLIVGFPGETERQFNELLEFVEWARFDALGCFEFYPESGTPAADMAGQVPEQVKRQRVEQLMLTQQKIAFAQKEKRVGGEFMCLIDSVDTDGTGLARFYGQAPEIDSICMVRNCTSGAGRFIRTRVVGTRDYDLIAEEI